MENGTVVVAENYDHVDGRNAYRSPVKRITLGTPQCEENAPMQIAAQLWEEREDGTFGLRAELPLHQVLDLTAVLASALLYFREAYRMPLLYDPDDPLIDKIALQGAVLPVSVCTDNPEIGSDIQAFSQALSDLGELTGERLRGLAAAFEKLELL